MKEQCPVKVNDKSLRAKDISLGMNEYLHFRHAENIPTLLALEPPGYFYYAREGRSVSHTWRLPLYLEVTL